MVQERIDLKNLLAEIRRKGSTSPVSYTHLEAKDETEYDNLSASAYLRAKEDYLMGINFSRVLTLK